MLLYLVGSGVMVLIIAVKQVAWDAALRAMAFGLPAV
jgi:hypothetical protein